MMRTLTSRVYYHFLPKRIRRSIDLFGNLRNPDTADLYEKNILVLSPHPDDDIVGCGGTVYKCRLKGSRVIVVYMTDGRKGNPHYSEDELVSVRKEEARRAAAVIGIEDLVFLKNRDGELSCREESVAPISKILNDYNPDAVFLPFLLDNHRDHMATNDIFVEASRKFSGEIMCYGYEVWTPLSVPNCVIDITKEMPKKIDALKQHKSQMTELNLIDAAVGLSKYRGAVSFLTDGNAEAFVRCPISEYRRLWEVVR